MYFTFDNSDVQAWVPADDNDENDEVLIRSAFMSNNSPDTLLNIEDFWRLYPEESKQITEWFNEHSEEGNQ